MLKIIKLALYRFKLHRYLARRRFQEIISLANLDLNAGPVKRVLEVGCHNGRDFTQFLDGNPHVELTGIDLVDHGISQSNFSFLSADAECLPFADDTFDLVVSIGVLEHIAPMEKLCKVVSEIDRVAVNHVIIVPSISTFVEPHTSSLLWQLRKHGSKRKYFDNLNFFSDEAWLSFEGFSSSHIKRRWLIPGLISNTYIYKK